MSTLKTGALRGTSGTADSIQLHASDQSVTFPGNITVTGTASGIPKIEVGNTKVEVTDTGSDGKVEISTEGTVRFTISKDGYITAPAQPAFWAYGGPNSSTTSGEILVFGSTEINIGGGYNTSDGKFTVPANQGGLWLFGASVYRANTEDDGVIGLKEGTNQIAESRIKSASAAGYSSLEIIRPRLVSTGNVLTVTNQGSDLHCNSTMSWFWGIKLF